jgi:DNA-binding HxlR family transcriptional regulator
MTQNAFDASLVGKALGARLEEIEATIERLRAFAFEPDAAASPPAVVEGEALDNARELVLRALRMMSDPLDYRVLLRLLEGDADLGALAALLALPRLAVWERVSDLVQAGLVVRSLEADQAGLTAAGQALVELVETIARAAGEGR